MKKKAAETKVSATLAKRKPKPRPTPKPRPAGTSTRKAFRIPDSDRAVVDAMDELFGGRPELRKGAMFGCPGYFLGAKAVACVYGDKLNLTLPQERVASLITQPGYHPFLAHGRAMNGWVLVDVERASSLDRDDELLEAAIAHARSKATKPTPGKKPPRTGTGRI